MPTVDQASSPMDSKREFFEEHPIGYAFEYCDKVLKGLSSRDRLHLLRALAGTYGHRVLPGTGLNVVLAQLGPKVGKRPKAVPNPKSRKSAEQIEIETEIKSVIDEIKDKSGKAGKRLDDSDPLLERRSHLFRRLQKCKTGHELRAPYEGP